MAQVLTPKLSATKAAVQPFSTSPTSANHVVDVCRPRSPRRMALPFRRVNLCGSPGYDPGFQRHHLLPRQLQAKRCFDLLFDEIGREWPGFDDFRSNGMLLPANDGAALRIGLPLHRGPHRDYNVMVIERVGHIEAHWSSLRRRSPQKAHGDAIAGLEELQQTLHQRLLAPGLKRLALNRQDGLRYQADFADLDTMVDLLWPDSDPWSEETATTAVQWPCSVISLATIPVRMANLAFA
jgi:hypothetical protein